MSETPAPTLVSRLRELKAKLENSYLELWDIDPILNMLREAADALEKAITQDSAIQMVGYIEGWKTRAEAAEAQVQVLAEGLRWYRHEFRSKNCAHGWDDCCSACRAISALNVAGIKEGEKDG